MKECGLRRFLSYTLNIKVGTRPTKKTDDTVYHDIYFGAKVYLDRTYFGQLGAPTGRAGRPVLPLGRDAEMHLSYGDVEPGPGLLERGFLSGCLWSLLG